MFFSPSKLACFSVLALPMAQATDAPDLVTAEASTPVVRYSEMSRKTVILDDHKVTLIRVRPPVLPKAPPPPPPRDLTPEEQATAERMAEKEYVTLSVSGTVYLTGKQPVTELRWRDETGELSFVAYSNADLRYLTQLSNLETKTTVYSWFPFVDAWNLAEWPADQKSPIPRGLNFSATETEYFVDARATDLKSQEATLAGLDYLHAYYQLHYTELKADFEKREAENAERERELRENPPKTPDATLRWWPLSTKPSSR